MSLPAKSHASDIQFEIRSIRNKEERLTPLLLAKHFGEAALCNKSKDNMTCVVTQLDPQSQHGCVTGVYDAAGKNGYRASQAAMKLSRNLLPKPCLIDRLANLLP